ncbi:MAG: hypothetical protein KTR26_22155 [Flammeovirgaceae bacterium]|nr:hypothetical protein [Flammeovirgaceae bacterium]
MKKCSHLKTLLIFVFACLTFEGQALHEPEEQFAKADSIAGLYAGHSILDLRSLSEKLTTSLSTDGEKFRAIYSWVCNNIKNDYSFYRKNKKMREKLKDKPEALKEWNRKSHPKAMKTLIKEHKTVCTGYAYLVKELAYFANIECNVINGYGRTIEGNIGGKGIVNHSWNSVKINNTWYLCDPTWSSGLINVQKAGFVKQFNEGYYLSAPELFVLNHYPLDTTWLLLNKKPTLDEFLNRPLVYRGAFSQKIIPQFPSTFHVDVKKGEKFTLRFEALDEIQDNKVELQINRSSSGNSIFPEIYQDAYGYYCLDHTFLSTGTFDVHLLLDNQYILTYSIKVIR